MTRSEADIEHVKAFWEAKRAGKPAPVKVDKIIEMKTGRVTTRIGCRNCKKKDQWVWVVEMDGLVIESGEEKTHDEAVAAVAEVLKGLEES